MNLFGVIIVIGTSKLRKQDLQVMMLHQQIYARAVSVYVLKKILALLHPYAPFITEELWSHFKNDDDKDLIVSEWPKIEDQWINKNCRK